MPKKRIDNKRDLNKALIEHYQCFNTERFYLDDFNVREKFVSVVTSTIRDTCPVTLCRNIAKYVKKISVANEFLFIYVGAWNFKVSDL